MPIVGMPDGTQVQFPDEMPSEQIRSLIAQKFPDAAKSQTTQSEALGHGILQGVTANFMDEISGLARAGGLETDDKYPPNPISALKALAVGGYKKLTGDPEAQRLYQEETTRQREREKLLQKEHPGTSFLGNVAGAVLLPGGAAMQAATLPARMARGAAVGAGYGGVAGFGAGEGLPGSIAQGATGAAIGAGVGAIAPPLVEGAIRSGQAVSQGARSLVRGAVNPEAEASRRVATGIYRDVEASPPGQVPGLTPQEFASHPNATIMDLGGETTRALARSAANTSPEGRDVLNRSINDRFEGQSGRIVDWLRRTFHFPNADAQQEALEQTSRGVNNAAYRRAYQEGSGGLWSPELERLAGSDAVNAAMRRAASAAGDESIIGGHGAMSPRITFTPDGRMQFNRGPTGMPTYPDLQYWDLVRRELSSMARTAGRGTTEERRFSGFARALNAELDRLAPSYQQARQGAASFFGAENALEAGQNFVTQNYNNAATRRALARMSDQERQLFQDGFVSRLIETLDRLGDRRAITNHQIFNNAANREKIAIALGPQRAAELEAGLRIEGILDFARNAVQGNSTTARQLVEQGLAGGGLGIGGVGAYNVDPTQMTVGAILAAVGRGSRAIDQRVARRVAELLISDNPQAITRGIQLIARSEQSLQSLRRVDGRLIATSTQQTAKIPQIGTVAARPEDNQPEAPR